MTACEALTRPADYEGRAVSLMGRLSKRDEGRFMSEDSCGAAPSGSSRLEIVFDRQTGPLPPEGFTIDSARAKAKFAAMAEHTTLREFKFGSGAYDRWAIVFGRLELHPAPAGSGVPARATIVCRGEALIFLWGASVN